VNSWDFFDTLLGRSTGREPWRLFDLVDGPDFRPLRQRAEAEAPDKTLDGIYRQLGFITDWPAPRLEQLRAREWQLEMAAAYPIVENTRRVAAGDLIVSDTYLTADEIRQLADRIGLPAGIEIVATYGGKHHGTVWPGVAARGIVRHFGDNRRSDVTTPRAAGIVADYYRGAEWTRSEQSLANVGLWAAAGAMRAVRLQNPHPAGSLESELWNCQAAGNVGFLWAAAAAVRHFARETGRRRILFCSRDTILLQRVFSTLYPDIESKVFWASRQVYTHPTPTYLDYARQEITPDSLVVDLHGTGASLQRFRESSGLEIHAVVVVGLCGGQRRRLMHATTLTDAVAVADGTSIEVCNYDTGGRVVDVTPSGPVRDRVEYDAARVQVFHDAVAAACRVAVAPSRPPSRQELARLCRQSCQMVPQILRRQHVAFHPHTCPH